MNKALNLLSDGEGTVTFGFLAADVYYVRITGHLSSKVGIDCATHFRQHLAAGPAIRVFADAASGTGSAFAARSAIMRALLANRRTLHFLTILVAPGPMAARAQAMVETLDRPNVIIDSPALFQTQVQDAVPPPQYRGGPASGTIRVSRSARPPARSWRPRARMA